MPAPIPVVTPIADLLAPPAGGTVALSCSASTVGPSASYQWQLIEQPVGGSAALTNATTAAPTLTGVTLRGTYIVFLTITDSGGSSHAYPYPTQATTAPYGFTSPLATAFGVVRVAEESGLFKPGRGEYGWFEKGLWPLVDKVNDGLTFSRYDDPTRTLTANVIVPDNSVAPSNNSVAIAGLSVRNDTANTENELYSTHGKINVLSHLHVSNKDVTVSGGILKADTIRDASGGSLIMEPNGGLVVNTSTVAVTADYGATIEMAGTVSETLAVTSNGILQLRAHGALQVQGMGDSNISLTTANGFISAYGPAVFLEADTELEARVGTSLLSLGGDVSLTSADDLTLTASGSNGDVNIVAAGLLGDIKLSAGALVALETTGGNGQIELKPNLATTSLKPVRAPGLVICDTVSDKSTSPYGPGPLFISTVPVYSRHDVASDLDVNITVAVLAAKLAAVELVLSRTVGSGTEVLATINSGTLPETGWCLFSIRCRTKLVGADRTVIQLEYDFTPPAAGLDIPVAPGSPTRLYAIRNDTLAGSPVSFQVSTSNTLLEYYAQMTCALYNPHNQDVL
jgi:hypothetical protein